MDCDHPALNYGMVAETNQLNDLMDVPASKANEQSNSFQGAQDPD